MIGAGILLLTIVPAYLASRPSRPSNIARGAIDSGEAMVAQLASAEADDPVAPEISVVDIDTHIREVAARHGLSPRLVAAVVEAESEFNPRAVSRKGAQGLMQLMPDTAARLRVVDPFDPRENIEGGVRHLRGLMERFDGNVPLVLAAYNAGETAVIVHGGVPPYQETRRYVARILRRAGHGGLVDTALGKGRAAPAQTTAVRHGSRRLVADVLRPVARPRVARQLPDSALAPSSVRPGGPEARPKRAAALLDRDVPTNPVVGLRPEPGAHSVLRPGVRLLDPQGP